MELIKKKHGGPRSNSGPKPKYNEPTETISFRCPKSKVSELKEIINKFLTKLTAVP